MTDLTDILTPNNLVTTTTIGTLAAGGLKSATTDVITAAATAPTTGQVLTATSDSLATWQDAAGGIALTERTSNTILGAADSGGLFDITSGTFTQTFDAVATLGADWFVYLRNLGSGDITLDPNASEQIDGLTSFIMYPGECRLIQCNGAKLTSFVITPFRKSFLTSGTFTKPPGYQGFSGHLWSGGASGGRTNGVNNGLGGAGGGCIPFEMAASFISATETVTIGAGGAAFSGTSDTGNVGGDSSFGTLVYCYAGGTTVLPGGGTKDSVGDVSFDSEGASYAASDSGFQLWGGSTSGSPGGNAIHGGAGGGSIPWPLTTPAAGGTSKFGGNGGAASTTTPATAGSQPGGGGGGTNTGSSSGAGGDGQMDIWGTM